VGKKVYTIRNLQPDDVVSPPYMVCVTALPCKNLITSLPICMYMLTTINNNKYKRILYFSYESC